MSEKKVIHKELVRYAIEYSLCGEKVHYSETTCDNQKVTCPACLKAMKGGEDAGS